ncbi:DUF6233 domain-containing protein [Streptomyces sp. YGL11-2]|uniref:DUF6233 domain-containing protein n=1 Tax=Streptomyces sp. YGL11-2 TaxID=3414028 RepID=UPI003CEB8E33
MARRRAQCLASTAAAHACPLSPGPANRLVNDGVAYRGWSAGGVILDQRDHALQQIRTAPSPLVRSAFSQEREQAVEALMASVEACYICRPETELGL